MHWIRRLLGLEAHPAEPFGVSEEAAAAALEADLDAEDAQEREDDPGRPVDLSAGLDAGLDPGRPAHLEAVSQQVLALALQAEREVERPFLAELARRLRRGDLRLPPMPQAVVKVQRLLDSPQCNVADLAHEIEVDPALTTRLVGIANSPFYQVLGPVRALGDAVVRIGLGETRNIVMAVTLRSRVFRVPGREVEISQLWSHSVAASLSAQVLGACVGEDPDTCFLLGLLHDLGRVVLLSMSGEIERDSKSRQRISPELEAQLDAMLHGPLGAAVAESWRIGPDLVAAIAGHHSRGSGPMWKVARCADLMAHRIAPVEPPRSVSESDWDAALEALGLDRESAAELEAEAEDALRTRGKRL